MKWEKAAIVMLLLSLTVGMIPASEIHAEAQSPEMLQTSEMQTQDMGEVSLVKGDSLQLTVPDGFQGAVTWFSGNGVRIVGVSKIKRPLADGESDGGRTAGWADMNHIASVEQGMVTAHEKGTAIITATDADGREAQWTVHVLYADPATFPAPESADYAQMRTKWKESIVGKDNDLTNGKVAEIIAGIQTACENEWNTYLYRGQESCPDVPWEAHLKDAKGIVRTKEEYQYDAVLFRKSFVSVEKMAIAYGTPELSQYYKNPELLKDIRNIMDYLTTTCYTKRSQTENWWTWEIGIPKSIVPICLFIFDDVEHEKIEQYTEALMFFQPDPFHEGAIGQASTHAQGYRINKAANLMDCSVTAMGMGILLEDSEQLVMARDAASTQLVLQPAGSRNNGLYADGSYLDHFVVPYINSYGIEFIKGSIKLLTLLGNTPWSLPEEKAAIMNTFALEGCTAAVYQGAALDMFRGRAVARPALSDRKAAADIIGVLLKLADAVDEETSLKIKTNVKNWIVKEKPVFDYMAQLSDIELIFKARALLNDDSIGTSVGTLHKNYPLLDRAVHRQEHYLAGLSMYSSRISNCEIMNHENRRGWHMGDGMLYIYNSDLNQFTDNFWNTVNPYRLPGTTVVPVDIGNGTKDSSGFYQAGDYLSREDWVGGTSIGDYGINGMALNGDTIGNGDGAALPYAPELRAFKSYFMFDDEIVCLGAGISNKDESLPTETTIENRKIKEDNSNRVTVDGETADVEVQKEIAAGWVHLEGNVADSDLGYYFPDKSQKVNIRKVANTGDWTDIGTGSGIASRNYLEMWIDHGTNPADADYEYVLLPGKNEQDISGYADEPDVEILENTKEIQAVRENSLQITGANFWTDGEKKVAEITCDKKASVMMREEGNVLTISASDPTMKGEGLINLVIDRKADQVIAADPEVATSIEGGKISLSINSKDKFGYPSVVKVILADEETPAPGTEPSETPPGEQPSIGNPENPSGGETAQKPGAANISDTAAGKPSGANAENPATGDGADILFYVFGIGIALLSLLVSSLLVPDTINKI
ncbi:polysaccharide lyase 8 family protein [Anaerobium acetethylicum]|uniref:Hyaluronate lyase n=1 Tax=Anaerobium acetethylicum TaxID=1619234 RepID=A0A1D3TUB7_9FIRM|nr:polysaccharide lyase 8 family protein [Anaerobium acetethylicum]SCP97626.1 hyaluronate lyase [Anaerobium acetethylicum]